MPIEDAQAKKRFPRMFRNSFWRIAMREWKYGYQEIALTIRTLAEFTAVKAVLKETLAGLNKS